MPDKYASFADLEAAEPSGAFRIECHPIASGLAVIAPHGGKIEPGTSQICRAIAAGHGRAYYLFEGCKPDNNSDLHITSTRFDEPQCLDLVASARVVLAIHGQAGNDYFVNVGGLDNSLGDKLVSQLKAAGYAASRHTNQDLAGLNANNVCNRGSSGRGVQLEISRGLRDRLVADAAEMHRFVNAVNSGLEPNDRPGR